MLVSNLNQGDTMSKNRFEIDMLNGSIMPKLISFALPLMASSILQLLFNAVDVITVGQFTGLHDINGKEIYEGDIVTMKRTPKGRSMSVTSRHVVKSHSVTDWDFHSLAKEILSFSMFNFHEEYSIYNHHVEVIGNIHDNPELAKPYSLNLPEPKQRKKRNKPFKIEFIVKD